MAIMAATAMQNNRGGNGQFSAFRRQQNNNKRMSNNILERKDSRMRFKNSRDPIYIIFDHLDKQPLDKLAKEFVQDSIFEIMQFVSTVKEKMS